LGDGNVGGAGEAQGGAGGAKEDDVVACAAGAALHGVGVGAERDALHGGSGGNDGIGGRSGVESDTGRGPAVRPLSPLGRRTAAQLSQNR
jgi:hypothetical protein